MTCRIDRIHSLGGLVLRVSGRIAAEDCDLIRAALEEASVVAIDLAEIELIDRDGVKLLAAAEAAGIRLIECPAYIREWLSKL